jgi:hypothetical protein
MSPQQQSRVHPPGTVHQIMEREEHERHNVENRRRAQYEAYCNTPCFFCSVVIGANNHLNTSLTTHEES